MDSRSDFIPGPSYGVNRLISHTDCSASVGVFDPHPLTFSHSNQFRLPFGSQRSSRYHRRRLSLLPRTWQLHLEFSVSQSSTLLRDLSSFSAWSTILWKLRISTISQSIHAPTSTFWFSGFFFRVLDGNSSRSMWPWPST